MARIPPGAVRGEEVVFFDALGQGRIVFQVCEACGAAIWYLRTVCPVCMGASLRLEDSAGRGVVHSFTTLDRAGSPGRAEDVPYTVALVDLDEGIRVIGDLVPAARQDVIGMRVTATARQDGIVFEEADA